MSAANKAARRAACTRVAPTATLGVGGAGDACVSAAATAGARRRATRRRYAGLAGTCLAAGCAVVACTAADTTRRVARSGDADVSAAATAGACCGVAAGYAAGLRPRADLPKRRAVRARVTVSTAQGILIAGNARVAVTATGRAGCDRARGRHTRSRGAAILASGYAIGTRISACATSVIIDAGHTCVAHTAARGATRRRAGRRRTEPIAVTRSTDSSAIHARLPTRSARRILGSDHTCVAVAAAIRARSGVARWNNTRATLACLAVGAAHTRLPTGSTRRNQSAAQARIANTATGTIGRVARRRNRAARKSETGKIFTRLPFGGAVVALKAFGAAFRCIRSDEARCSFTAAGAIRRCAAWGTLAFAAAARSRSACRAGVVAICALSTALPARCGGGTGRARSTDTTPGAIGGVACDFGRTCSRRCIAIFPGGRT